MQIKFSPNFEKYLLKRVPCNSVLFKKFKNRVDLFISDQSNPILKDHALTGSMKGLRSFSITGDIRIIYQELDNNYVLFINIGSHNQVYNQ
jgi:addiction module RelE/StbE family toxin